MSRGSSATITTRPIPRTFCAEPFRALCAGVVLGLSCGVVPDGPIRLSRNIHGPGRVLRCPPQRWIGPEGVQKASG